MKIKLTALICIMAMLVSMLAGCGTPEQETVMETAAETTVVEETTVPETTVETEPEEPETMLETMGLTTWEDAQIIYPGAIENEEGSWIPGVRAEYSDFQLEFVSFPDSGKKKVIMKELVPSDLTVIIQEFQSENFNSQSVKDAVDAFYNRDNLREGKISKDAWLTQHQGYKIVSCTILQYCYINEYIDDSIAMGANTYWIGGETPAVLDQSYGFLMEPSGDWTNEVGWFSFDGENGEIDISCLFTFNVEFFRNSATNSSGDAYVEHNVYALVPEDYEGIAFTYGEAIAMNEDEGYINDEPDVEPWTHNMLPEYIEEKDRYHMHYFNMVK